MKIQNPASMLQMRLAEKYFWRHMDVMCSLGSTSDSYCNKFLLALPYLLPPIPPLLKNPLSASKKEPWGGDRGQLCPRICKKEIFHFLVSLFSNMTFQSGTFFCKYRQSKKLAAKFVATRVAPQKVKKNG